MDKRMTNTQAKYESLKRALRAPLVVALGALAFPGTAAARPKAVTPEPQPALTAPLVINPAAVIKDRLVHRKQVTFDAAQGVNWGPGELSQTTVPLTAEVDGHTDYFSLTQTKRLHGTLRSLRVTQLVNLAPDALVSEQFPILHDSNATPSQSGVITVNTVGAIPAAEVTWSDGEHFLVSVGQTQPNPFPPQP
jgi:hypothetical protein